MNKFTSHSTPICYQTYGDPKHPCLILVNGIGGQLISWTDDLLQRLVQHNLYVIIFDNRDSGLSHSYHHLETPSFDVVQAAHTRGEKIQPPYTLDAMAYDITLLMDALDIKKAHISGISMGGMIAQVFALNFTKRTHSLICIATTSQDSHLPPPHPEVLKYFSMPKENNANFEAFINSKLEAYKLYNHPDHFNEEKARAFCIRAYERAYNPQGFMRQLYAVISAEPRGDKLKNLSLPSLIIHGNLDPVFPIEHGEYLANVLPNNRFITIENMGHGLLEFFSQRIADEIAAHIHQIA